MAPLSTAGYLASRKIIVQDFLKLMTDKDLDHKDRKACLAAVPAAITGSYQRRPLRGYARPWERCWKNWWTLSDSAKVLIIVNIRV